MPIKEKSVFESVSETYTSQGIVGQGATADVYKVVDSDGHSWALKCLRADQAKGQRLKRFLNEMHYCKNTTHKNVVKIMDEGFAFQGDKKCPFYVMPLYETTLRKLMNAGIPHDKILPVFANILDGVEAGHLQRVWHRDLKPENILCDSAFEEIVVSDYGIAHLTEELKLQDVKSVPEDRLANFQYAAPEQRDKGKVDGRADIYALGLILNEMFVRKIPHGLGYKQIGFVAKEFEYLDELVSAMLQHSPENRPQTVEAIKNLLIHKKNEFVSKQKLDALTKSVVPSATVTDDLVNNPPEAVAFDIARDALTITLSRPVNSEWISVFGTLGNFASLGGGEPKYWVISRSTAVLNPPLHLLEQYGQQLIDDFKKYVHLANESYRETAERAAKAKEIADRAHLQRQIADGEWRNSMLKKLHV
jgi:serine/threonine protein kinase